MRLPTALVIQHDADDPPGRVGDWLRAAGVQLDLVRPYDGDPMPADIDGYHGLVVLGGEMSAHDDAIAPWLAPTRALLRQAATTAVPTLAICLGAQLLAAAFGGRVAPNPDGPEIGPSLVAKRDIAAKDPLFGPVPFTPDVLQWHCDRIADLPTGAVLLASSPLLEVQAFRYGELAWGLQFHIETTPEMVLGWAKAEPGYEIDHDALAAVHDDLAEVWAPFTNRFAELVRRAEYDRREPA